MRIITSLGQWTVSLKVGGAIVVWADGYSEVGDDYVFSFLVDRDIDEPGLDGAEIADRTPSNPRRVSIVTARIPAVVVETVESA